MIDDTQLTALLRSALPPVVPDGPSHDLWPLVVNRSGHREPWSLVDVGLAAVVVLALVAWPDLLLLLAYHL